MYHWEGLHWNELEEKITLLVKWISCIGQRYKYSNQIVIISIIEIEVFLPTLYLAPLFNKQIKQVLREGKVVAGCNTSVKNNIMGAY